MPDTGVGLNTGAGRQRPAPVCVLAVLSLMLIAGPAAGSNACRSDRIDETVRISHVSDGDTLVLGDGRRLRIIGIDTPELGRDGAESQAGALAARERLRQLVFINQQQLGLRFDQDRQDRYGRLLAHAFLRDGANLSEKLLREGFAFQLVIPPNTWQASCYDQAEQSARQARLGVWSYPDYRARQVAELDLRSEGFMRIQGRVSHIGDSTRAVWINLVGNAALRIDREDLVHFPAGSIDRLVGADIEAQGWLYARNGQLRMQVRHPAALHVPGTHPPAPAAQSVE